MFKISTTYQDLGLTLFPDGQDSFPQWLNIVASDGALILQYQQAMNQGNQTLANQILAQIPSASQKIVKATDVNKMNQCIQAVERFYGTDIEPYIENKQQEWTNIINQFSYKGNWSSSTQYYQNNMVTYSTGGVTFLYICTAQPPIGTPPTNTQYFRQATVVGVQGPAGQGLSFAESWDSSTTYDNNTAVIYGGALWQSLQQNTNVPPGTNDTVWKSIFSLSTTTFPIQDQQPVSQQNGELWFNTQNNPTSYVKLDPLANPATADNIMAGFEAYNDEGDALVGTLDVYTKSESDAKYLHVDGSNAMTGDLNAGNNNVINVADPVNDNDAVNKKYFSENNLSAVIKTLPIADGYTVNQGDVVDISNNQIVKTIVANDNVKSNFRNNSFTQGSNIILTSETKGVWLYFSTSEQASTGYESVAIQGWRLRINPDTTATSIVGSVFQVYSATPSRNTKATPSVKLDENRILVSWSAYGLGAKIITLESNNEVTLGQQYNISNISFMNTVALISNDLVLFVYVNDGLKGKVCTISNDVITLGTEYSNSSFTNNNIDDLTATLLPDDDSGNHRVLICFSDLSDNSKGKAVIATINNSNEINWSSPIVFASQETSTVAINHITAQYLNQFIYVIYRQNEGIWCTKIPLSTLQPETPTLLVSISGTQLEATSCVVNNKLIIAYLNTNGLAAVVNTNTMTLLNPYTFNSGSVSNLVVIPYGNSQFLIGYADVNNNNYVTTTILEAVDNQIAGNITVQSSTAIALQPGTAGQSIECIFSGTTNASFVSEGQVIESPGVYGVGVMDGILQVWSKARPGQVVTGSYVGTGTSGQSNPITLTVGTTPKLLAVSGRMSNATGTTVAVYGATLVQGSSSQSGFSNFTMTWSSNGVSWYSSDASEQMNISGEVYCYTIVC